MNKTVKVILDKPAHSARQAAIKVKEALLGQWDTTCEVYYRTNDEVLVLVYESADAVEEITERLNLAGLRCFVEETDDVPADGDVEVTYPLSE